MPIAIACDLSGKKITLAITGGIAAYKAAELASWLHQRGAAVQVAMTASATQFITPLTLKALTGRPVAVDIMSQDPAFHVPHIDIADCDLFIVAPATGNIMAKAAHGIADELVSAALLATKAPVLFAPAMHHQMYHNPATQENMRVLASRGYFFVEPGQGHLACGATGDGRLAEPPELAAAALEILFPQRPWAGLQVLISAGPTREKLDPVRYISNFSSGKMGYALAAAAHRWGANVTLVSGPTAIMPPAGVQTIFVESALDMQQAMESRYGQSQVVIMSAAVADYRARAAAPQKLKKGASASFDLVANPDILAALGQKKQGQVLVGFAAETNDVETYAKKKLAEKNLDMIVVNNVAQAGAGFGSDTNIITIYEKGGAAFAFPQMTKEAAAVEILTKISELPAFTPYKR